MRRARGNMLILVSLLTAVNALAVIIAGSFGGLWFVHNRLQSSADEIALAGARKLNELDRLGQMNNMIARSRQLVFASRQNLNAVSAEFPHLNSIATRLLDEAHDGATTLETERQKLRALAINEARAAMLDKFNQIKVSYAMTLPWMRVATPVMSTPACGKVEGVESCVEQLVGIEELKDHDNSAGYVRTSPHLNLYKQDIDARLPLEDSHYSFRIGSLAAPVGKDIAPARIVLAEKFRAEDDQLCSATQVQLSLQVSTGLGPSAASTLRVRGTAAATGAGRI